MVGQGLGESQQSAHIFKAQSRHSLSLDTCCAVPPVFSDLEPRWPSQARPASVLPQHLDTPEHSPWLPVLFTCLFP